MKKHLPIVLLYVLAMASLFAPVMDPVKDPQVTETSMYNTFRLILFGVFMLLAVLFRVLSRKW